MKNILTTLALPGLALGAATLILAPAPESYGFSTIGGSLSAEGQRDWRVFDNFIDSQTNNNVTPHSQFPGWTGAEMALWKAASEWGSRAHGNGTGDPFDGTLGSGLANFDFVFSGTATSAGGSNRNIVSALTSCGGGGTFAYVLSPIQDGWTMKFCDEWIWSDGPNAPPGSQIDLQGVGTHEFGHSLGLGHSNVGGATMVGSTFNGFNQRSLAGDDRNGVQFIYGAVSGSKAQITSVSVDTMANTLSITGLNFSPTNNQVWFTRADPTTPGAEPRLIVSGVASSAGGTQIDLSIPAGSSPGDVHVKTNATGFTTLSNGFPVDLDPTPDPGDQPPVITSITPSSVESLIPGIAQTVSLHGTDFTSDVTVNVGGTVLDPADFTFVNSALITLDMPLTPALGLNSVTVANGFGFDTDFIDVVAPSGLVLEAGNGEQLNLVSSVDGIDFTCAGPVGSTHYVLFSFFNDPSVIPIISLDIGAGFTDLDVATAMLIPAAGFETVNVPVSPQVNVFYFQSISLNFGTPIPTSNLQSITLFP